jgi:hypothetical protein
MSHQEMIGLHEPWQVTWCILLTSVWLCSLELVHPWLVEIHQLVTPHFTKERLSLWDYPQNFWANANELCISIRINGGDVNIWCIDLVSSISSWKWRQLSPQNSSVFFSVPCLTLQLTFVNALDSKSNSSGLNEVSCNFSCLSPLLHCSSATYWATLCKQSWASWRKQSSC